MKITVDAKEFSSRLGIVSRAIPSRPSHPILSSVLVEATGETVTLTGFDLSIGIKTAFPADVHEVGRYALPATLLSEIVSKLDGDIAIAVEDGDDSESAIAHLSTATANFKIRALPATEYPELPKVEGGSLTLPAIGIDQSIASVLFAASNDETKQVLTGVRWTRGIDSLEFAATDGHRLAVATLELEGEKGNAVTIPARSLSLLSKLLIEEKAEEVALTLDDGIARFAAGDTVLTCRVLDGEYPKYDRLLPKSFEGFLTVDRRSLLKALELVGVLADHKRSLVILEIQSKSIAVTVETADLGNGKQVVSCELTGKPTQICFNIKYLSDALKAIATNEAKISFNHPTMPVILEPVGGELKVIQLVMPTQIQK